MFKNFFLNRIFTPTPYNLIWDSLLVWIAGSAIFFLPNQIQQNGFFTSVVAYLITVVLFGGWFGWRRAWIQRAIQNHYKNEQLEAFNERQRASEQKQTQTLTQRAGSHPKLGLIDAPLSQQQPRAERGTNARLGLIDEPLPRKVIPKTEAEPLPFQDPQPDPDDQLQHYYYSYSIAIPLSFKWSSSQATAFIRSLLARANGWVQLSIVGQPGKVFWEVTHFAGEHEQPLTEAVIAEVAAAHYPGSQVKRLVRDHRTEMKRRYKIMGADFNFWFDEGLTADDIKNRDPLLEVVRVMSQLKPGEELRYRISIIAVNPPDQQNIESIIFVSAREMYEPVNGPVSPTNWSSLAGSLAGVAIGRIFQEIQLRSQKVLRFSEKDTQRYLQKLSQPLVTCFVSVEMDSPDASRLITLEHMVGAVEQLTSGSKLRLSSLKAYTSPVIPIENQGDFIFKTPLDYLMDLAPEKAGDLDGTLPYLFSLTIDELGALWHLPSHLFEAGGGDILRPTLLPPELLDPDPSQAVIVGQAEGHAIGIQMRDLNLHAFVAGMQGQGKSTLLTNLAQQLIAAGHGVAIIDPHRKLINDIIDSSIDDEAAKRTVLLEAEDSAYPIPLNPMRATPGMSRDGLFSSLMWIIKALSMLRVGVRGRWSGCLEISSRW